MDTRTLDTPLTGIHDTDQQILLHLDDESLFTFCSVSKSAQFLCNETFWWRKFVKEFGTDLEESKKNGIEINYKKIYKQLRNLNDTDLFFQSAEKGYIDLVKRLIELKRVDRKGLHEDKDYALQLSSASGYLDLVKYLIEHGSDIHADNDLALRWASAEGHLDVVKYLIEHDADIHAENDYALIWASVYGQLDVVKYLIEQGANINVLRNVNLPANITNYLKSITDNNNNENGSESLQCEGITKKGTRCKKNKSKGSKYCSIHK